MEFPVEFGCDDAADEKRQELDCAAGDLEVLCAEGVKAKGFDNDRSELIHISIPGDQ